MRWYGEILNELVRPHQKYIESVPILAKIHRFFFADIIDISWSSSLHFITSPSWVSLTSPPTYIVYYYILYTLHYKYIINYLDQKTVLYRIVIQRQKDKNICTAGRGKFVFSNVFLGTTWLLNTQNFRLVWPALHVFRKNVNKYLNNSV